MKALLLATALFLAPVSALSDDAGARDWTIERPVLAGFLTGLTVGLCRGCRLGAGVRPAGSHDPFAMTPLVRSELMRLAARPYHLGQAFGTGYLAIVIGGVFFRRLNRLRAVEKTESAA